jgi:hypothetical protein
MVRELDLNPIIAFADRLVVVDARIVVEGIGQKPGVG